MFVRRGALASVFLAASLFAGEALAYGSEGLFGGRGSPDGSLSVSGFSDMAQDRPNMVKSVLDAPRPGYDSEPMEIGEFELYPLLEMDSSYDSNIYAVRTDRRDDAIGAIRPIVNLYSNWDRHALEATAFGDAYYYSEHSDENYVSGAVNLRGRYDIAKDAWVSSTFGHQMLAESRSSPNAVVGIEPTDFSVSKGSVTGFYGTSVASVLGDYAIKRFDFENTPAAGGVLIDQSYRNRTEHLFSAKSVYTADSSLKPYVSAAYNIRAYDTENVRDSSGFQGVVGVTYDHDKLFSVDLFAGWMVQNYDDFPGKKKVSTPKIGGRFDLNLADDTSLAIEADRSIEETTVIGANSYTQTGGSMTLTHELKENLLLEVGGAYSNLRFNSLPELDDNEVSAHVGGRYMVNKNLYTELAYNWSTRASTEDAAEFYRNAVTLRIGVRY